MLNKSIAYRLSIYISLAVISVFIAFIGIYFLFNKNLIEENLEHKAISLSAEITNDVNRYVVSINEITSSVSENILYYNKKGEADHFLYSIVSKYSFVNSIHVNIDSTVTDIAFRNFYCFRTQDSVLFQKSNEKIINCLSNEKSVKNLRVGGTQGWSEPYLCKKNNTVVVALYYPIYIDSEADEKKIVGEVFCELSLLELNKSVNKVEVGKNGFAFLLSRQGVYITHPIKEWILKKNILDLSKIVFDISKLDIGGVMNTKQSGTLVAYPELNNFKKSWVYYAPITDNGWILIFVLPFQELYEPLYLPILQMLFFSVLGILIIYLLVTYITGKLIEPLSTITSQLKRFSASAGDTNDISENEVKQIAESLNFMKAWHEKYKVTQSEEELRSKSRKRDISQASEIQRSFIKTEFPAFPDRSDIDVYAIYKPAKGVSGDLFDFFFIDNDHLVFTIGDVSGKGIPAAFFMSVAQTIIKKNSSGRSAKSIVANSNKELYTNNQHQFFLTLFLGVLNVKTGKVVYCNAAHTAPYILKANGSLVGLAQSHGLPLGLYSDKYYQEAEVILEKGDSVVLYTDGVNELQDANKLQYGNERLEENLRRLAGSNPKDIVRKIEKSLELFIGESNQSDDISILILKYIG